jgi:outer membrane receptor protein involved in Fe transport
MRIAINAGLLALYTLSTAAFSSAHAQTAADQSGSQLAEIMVTANKRAEREGDVAMSITAVSGARLDDLGIHDVTDLQKVTPGLTVTTTYNSTPVYTIRGVGYFENSLAISPAVSVYTNEIPLPYSVMTEGVGLDMQRVEVLKGPQGTLFGQNSTGGAINYIPNAPTSEFKAGTELEYGSYNLASIRGYVGGPLADTLSVRFAGEIDTRDGWQISQTRPSDRLGKVSKDIGRLLLDFKPTDRISLELNVNGWVDRSDSQAFQFYAFKPSVVGPRAYQPANAALSGLPAAPHDPRIADWNANTNYAGNDTFHQLALRLGWDINDSLTLTSISSYARLDVNTLTDGDGTAYQDVDQNDLGNISSYFQELRLSGKVLNDKLNWIVGGNYGKDDSAEAQDLTIQATTVQLGPFVFNHLSQLNNQSVKTKAAFGGVDFALTPTLSLEASARYTESDNHHTGCQTAFDQPFADAFTFLANVVLESPNAPLQVGQCQTFIPSPADPTKVIFSRTRTQTDLDEHNAPWRVGLNWKPQEGSLFYGNVTKGFKAGSFSTLPAVNVAQLTPVPQESVLAFEVGTKQTLLNNTLTVDAAAFHYSYDDKQLRGYLFVFPFGNLPGLVTIPRSKIDGGEIGIAWRPTPAFTANLGLTYVKSEVTGDYNTLDPDGNAVNVRGEAFPFTPKFQLTSDAQYEIPINDRAFGYIGATLRYQTQSQAAFGENLAYELPSYPDLDARVGVRGTQWRVEFWSRNLTNRYYLTNMIHVIDTQVGVTGLPRFYGARVSYNF